MELYEYVRELRTEHGITIEQLCDGICSESMLKLFELGHRELSSFAMFRLMERLEYGEGTLQYFMKKQEFEQWKSRMEILDAIRRKDYDCAEEKIAWWKQKVKGNDKFAKQFLHRMRSFCMIHNKNDRELICEEVGKAIEITVPDFATKWRSRILSMHEVDMLLDYYHYTGHDCRSEIMDIIVYMKKKDRVLYRRNILFGKAIAFYVKEVAEHETLEKWSEKKLLEIKQLSEEALEVLRKADCSFYLWEVLQIRKSVLSEVQRRKIKAMDAELKENERWMQGLLKMYNDLGVSAETTEILLLYTIMNVEAIDSVIGRRRNLLNMTKEELADDKCDVRTIIRIETKGQCPQTSTLELLLEKLGLPGVWKKSYFLSYDVDTRKRMQELVTAYRNGQYKEVLRIVEHEKRYMDDVEIFNAQNLEWYRIESEYHLGLIDSQQAVHSLKENLEKSIKWKDIIESGMDYVSLNEAKHVTAILQHMDKDDLEFEKLLEVVGGYVAKSLGDYKEMNYATMLSVSLNILQARYADVGEYKIANQLCAQMKDSIFFSGNIYRMMNLVYDMWWNKNELSKTSEGDRPSYLIDVANLIQDSFSEHFFKNRFAD